MNRKNEKLTKKSFSYYNKYKMQFKIFQKVSK